MYTLRCAAAFVLAVLVLTTQAQAPRASVDATSAWDHCCTAWEMPNSYVGAGLTMHQAYLAYGPHINGHSEAWALAGITADVNTLLGATSPPPSGDDDFSYKLHNW